MHLLEHDLDRLYQRYGFEKRTSTTTNVSVYTLRSGYFLNAAIVPRQSDADADAAKAHFDAAGFACTIHRHESIEEAEEQLFMGFFESKSNRIRAQAEYEKFSQKLTGVLGSPYSYISGPFEVDSVSPSSVGPVELSLKILESDKPTLLIIEAAAGYGKTCTAFEIFHRLATSETRPLPILAELSRNRQAKIFRYVLLDEVNRLFPSLRYDLVSEELANGRLVLIVDGFDELLRSSVESSDVYEQAEPMLDTIGVLLKGKAHVVVTSRRTALFSGDAFETWIALRKDEFDVVRVRLKKPTVKDWVGPDREQQLVAASIPVHDLANPVLLSFIRGLSAEDFDSIATSGSERLVNYYFDSLLDREKERQQLRMEVSEQRTLFIDLARQMRDGGFTAESSEYLQFRLTDVHGDLLSHVRERYAASERPTPDELARKLVSHALLDKKGNRDDQIGFVNDFAFGVMLAEGYVSSSDDSWLGDRVFMDNAITSSAPRSETFKGLLLHKLSFALECSDETTRLSGQLALAQSPTTVYESSTFTGLALERKVLTRPGQFQRCVFVGCDFRECDLSAVAFSGASFVSCRFFDCRLHEAASLDGKGFSPPQFFSCLIDPASDLLDKLAELPTDCRVADNMVLKASHDYRVNVLLHFWPAGKPNIQRYRNVVRNLFRGEDESDRSSISSAIDDLRKGAILKIDGDVAEIDRSRISQIRQILGR